MKTCSFIYFWPNFDKSFLKNYFFNDYKYTDDYINVDKLSDTDDYINIEELIENKHQLYQIQLNNNELIIKNIGIGSSSPDLIIKENFGKNNNLSIYNCIITENEFNFESFKLENELFYPIIKLIEIKEITEISTYCLAIKLFSKIKYDTKITTFDNYFVYSNNNNKLLKYIKLEKNINSTNIIEILMNNYFNLNK